MGVNLPAHLVIIKGTRRWTGGDEGGGAKGYKEYDRSTCLQVSLQQADHSRQCAQSQACHLLVALLLSHASVMGKHLCR